MIYSTLRHPEKGDKFRTRALVINSVKNGLGMEIGKIWKLGPSSTFTQRQREHGWNYAGWLHFSSKYVYSDTVSDLRSLMILEFKRHMRDALG